MTKLINFFRNILNVSSVKYATKDEVNTATDIVISKYGSALKELAKY